MVLLIKSWYVQTDKRTGKPKIWIYKDKISGMSKGEATVTYDDANAARSAISWFDGESNFCYYFSLLVNESLKKKEKKKLFTSFQSCCWVMLCFVIAIAFYIILYFLCFVIIIIIIIHSKHVIHADNKLYLQ